MTSPLRLYTPAGCGWAPFQTIEPLTSIFQLLLTEIDIHSYLKKHDFSECPLWGKKEHWEDVGKAKVILIDNVFNH